MNASFKIILIFQFLSNILWAEKLQKWKEEILDFPTEIINESSGMVFSRNNHNVLYHINDSGDEAQVYITNLKAKFLRKVPVSSNPFIDSEAMHFLKCENGQNCIAIADIGNNIGINSRPHIYIYKEEDIFHKRARLIQSIALKVPQQKDSEAIAFDNNNNLLFLTKVSSTNSKAQKAILYGVKYSNWLNKKELILPEKIQEIDFNQYIHSNDKFAAMVTDMSFHPSKGELLILTYKTALLFHYSEMTQKLTFIENIPIHRQAQMEAISFDLKGDCFYVSSEKRLTKKIKLYKYCRSN